MVVGWRHGRINEWMNEPAALILRVELSSWEIMHNGQTDSVAEAARRYIHTRFRMWGSDELSCADWCMRFMQRRKSRTTTGGRGTLNIGMDGWCGWISGLSISRKWWELWVQTVYPSTTTRVDLVIGDGQLKEYYDGEWRLLGLLLFLEPHFV